MAIKNWALLAALILIAYLAIKRFIWRPNRARKLKAKNAALWAKFEAQFTELLDRALAGDQDAVHSVSRGMLHPHTPQEWAFADCEALAERLGRTEDRKLVIEQRETKFEYATLGHRARELVFAWRALAADAPIADVIQVATALTGVFQALTPANQQRLIDELSFDPADAVTAARAAFEAHFENLTAQAPSSIEAFRQIQYYRLTFLAHGPECQYGIFPTPLPIRPSVWNTLVATHIEAPGFTDFIGLQRFRDLQPQHWLVEAGEAMAKTDVVRALELIATFATVPRTVTAEGLHVAAWELSKMVATYRQPNPSRIGAGG